MRSCCILVVCFLVPLLAPAQNFIGKTKKQVTRFLERETRRQDSLRAELTVQGNLVHYSIKAGKVQPADFFYEFDKRGRCRAEKVTASCDSCFRRLLSDVLRKQKFEWEQINENQYISNYPAKLLLEMLPGSQSFTYTILFTNWNRTQYGLLRKK